MSIHHRPPRALARAVSLALGVAAAPATAVEYNLVGWYGDWETASGWDPVGVPQDGDSVTIHQGGIVTYDTASPLHLTRVTVDGSVELHITGSSLHADTLIAGMSTWSDSAIHLSGGELRATDLHIGYGAGSGGRVVWDGGQLDIDRIRVGVGGAGTFVQDIGWGNHWSLAPHQSLVIGEQVGSQGVFEQLSGSVDAYVSQIIVGEAGQGLYRQLAGQHSANETVIGHLAGSEGTYETGSWAVSHSSTRTVVGAAGTGHYIHNAGQHYTGELIVGRSAGATGDYLLNAYDGVTANSLVLGQDAASQGTFTWINGNLDVGRIVVGQAGAGRFVLEGWNDLALDDYQELVIGELAGSAGLFEQQGGYVTNTRTLFVGDAGHGVYRQTAGQHRTPSIVLGRQAGSEGVYELAGEGASLTTRNTLVGQQGAGRFVHTAGAHISQRIDVGESEGGGHYQFDGGLLSATTLNVNNGEFHWTGGELDVTGIHLGRAGSPDARGAFVQDIGPGNTLWLGWGRSIVIGSDDGEGVYEQRSGDVDAREGQLVVGGSGRGFYYHLDGMHLATETVIGRHQDGPWYPAQGTYGLYGEAAVHSAQRTIVGDTGRGRFLHSAGLNDTAELIVGRTGAGEYLLDGGALHAPQIVLGDDVTQTGAVAVRSDGRFFWSGGEFDFTGLVIGRRGTGEFVQDIGAGNTLWLGSHQSIVIAEQAGSQGAFEQRSGNVDSRHSPIVVGEGGIGTYQQMAGMHQSSETRLGCLSGSQGFYSLYGTAAHITQRTVIGDVGYGAYYQWAGSLHDTQELVLAQSSGAYGYYDLHGGELITTSTRIAAVAGATGGITVHGPDAHWYNSGTIDIGTATAGYASPGAAWVELHDGSHISATAVIVAETGALRGRGSVAADVINAGTLDPGVGGAGRFDVIGDYAQLAEGALFIQIGGHAQGFNADIVSISGEASLAGDLNVSLLGGYRLSLGDSFDILYANMVYGGFDDVFFPIFGGLTFDIAYDLNAVRLTVVTAVPVPAAVWLFGSGMLVLMGAARRRNAV